MAHRTFTGSYDPNSLSFDDLQSIAGALAVMERLEKAGVITFRSGVAVLRPRKGVKPEKALHIQPQMRAIIDKITGERWWSAREVSDALDLNRNSINAQLFGLASKGVIEMADRDVSGTREGGYRRTINVYRKWPEPT